ncbi:hypothetical protein WJX82_008974 [Trebouxia sp. C0006]
MPQVKPQRGARDPPYPPPGQFQAPAAYKAASSRPGRAKARTWVRPQSAEQSTPVSDPTPAPIQVAQQTVGSFISSLSKSVQVNQTDPLPGVLQDWRVQGTPGWQVPCPDVMPVCTFYLQGLCTTEECPYAHVKVDPNAPVCQEFVSGHCPRGVSCTKKHLTPRMIRQLRQSKALQADSCTSQQSKATVAQAHAAEAGQSVLQDEDLDLRPAFLR